VKLVIKPVITPKGMVFIVVKRGLLLDKILCKYRKHNNFFNRIEETPIEYFYELSYWYMNRVEHIAEFKNIIDAAECIIESYGSSAIIEDYPL